MVLHWNLSDKFSQVFNILLTILAEVIIYILLRFTHQCELMIFQ